MKNSLKTNIPHMDILILFRQGKELGLTVDDILRAEPLPTTKEKPADLIGKKLGISTFGTASDFSLRDIPLQVEIDPAKVAIVQIGDTSIRLASLLSGSIDGAVITRRQIIKDSPEKLRRFMRAYIEATYILRPTRKFLFQRYKNIADLGTARYSMKPILTMSCNSPCFLTPHARASWPS